MRRLLPVLLVALLLGVPGLAAAPAAVAQEGPDLPAVTVVAVPGLLWADVDATTPALERLAGQAAVGTLSVKALPDVSCVGDGLLTLGAGTRAEAYGTPCGRVPDDLEAQAERNARSTDEAEVALLGTALRAGGQCLDGPAAVGGTDDPGCPVRVVLVEEVGERGTDTAAADAAVAQAERDLPPGGALLVVGLSGLPLDTSAHLHLALATGGPYERGALTSASTRRDGWVQLVDVTPTVLALRGVETPPEVDGEPWAVDGDAPTTADLVDTDVAAQGQRVSTVSFFVVVLAAQLLAAVVLWRRTRALTAVALAGAAVPAGSFLAGLVPWWRAPLLPLLPLLAATALVSVALTLLALRGPWRRDPLGPVGVVATATTLVLLLDLLAGAPLQITSVTGYSPLVAGRFAGLGNVAFGVLAASSLLAATWLARGRVAVVAAVGVVVVAVVGAPPWGSDVGGVLALVPAFTLLALRVGGRRVSALRLLLAGAAAGAVVTALAVADWTRDPGDRTHLGRFVQDVVDGTAGDVLARKGEAVLSLLFRSPVTAALPLVVAAAVWLVVRPPEPLRRAFVRVPSYRHALVAVGAAAAVGFAVNDSGAAVPALALVVVVPATLAVVAQSRAEGRSGLL